MKKAARSARHGGGGKAMADDPHDAIELRLLTVWLGLSQLHEELRHSRRVCAARRPRLAHAKAAAVKRPRRKAA